MSDQSKLGIGKLIEGTPTRDAIHVAVVPVEASMRLLSGDKVELDSSGKAVRASADNSIGVVDPFLDDGVVLPGEWFWLFLNPGSITSLAHVWTHPSFPAPNEALRAVAAQETYPEKSASEQWMRRWALKHMSHSYFDDEPISDEQAYAWAIDAGRTPSIGPYESARDHINETWWKHWEAITGEKGDREQYFSCAC